MLCVIQQNPYQSCRQQTSGLITSAGKDQKQLYKITNKLLGRDINQTVLPNLDCNSQDLADKFASFFSEKISKIRSAINEEAQSDSCDTDNKTFSG